MIYHPRKLLFLLFIPVSSMPALDNSQHNKESSKPNELSFINSITILEPTHHDPTLDLAQSTPDCLDFISTPRAH